MRACRARCVLYTNVFLVRTEIRRSRLCGKSHMFASGTACAAHNFSDQSSSCSFWFQKSHPGGNMTNRRDLLRALVGLMKTVAAAYGIMIPASQRAATDEEVKKWYKKLIRRVHPDKGGCNGDFRRLVFGCFWGFSWVLWRGPLNLQESRTTIGRVSLETLSTRH